MGWTEERVTLLKKLWTEGHSASQIAKQLGGVTRNAVIGKVHRLGLAGRSTPSRPAKRPVRAARPRTPTAPNAPRIRPATYTPPVLMPVLDPLRLADGTFASVLTLNESMCKWPIGNPDEAGFAFCARPSCSGPYCADHARQAYQPSQARRRRVGGEPDELRRVLRAASF
ncbi:MAG: GcrA cell cycle regulator [Hyphomonadaceae bacterium]|nr:GcrA cell cycle regulator [Hyphomonadaceae bacterium]